MLAQAASRTSTPSAASHAVNGSAVSRASPHPPKKTTASTTNMSGMQSTPSGGAAAPSTTTATSTPSKPQRPARRIEIEPLMNDFRRTLGTHWDQYREIITSFLTGHLTRIELERELSVILDKSMVRMHNQFLLASLANALRDPPPSSNGLPAWSMRSRDAPFRVSKKSGDSVVARLKSEIMGFTPRERRRIKAITSDAGKKGPIPSTVVLTKQARSVRFPSVKEKEKSKTNITQEITQSYQAPLATESFELPDTDSLRTRILGIAYEHGLLDGIANDVPDIILAGLEYHLRDFLQQLLDRVRPKKHKILSDTHFVSLANASTQLIAHASTKEGVNGTGETGIKPSPDFAKGGKAKSQRTQQYEDDNIITAEDMALALELAPHSIVEPSGPLYRLWDVMLRDEIDDLPVSTGQQ
ncbi:transcriptional regulator of RNA polII, SAGA, subunit-domain-containing protein [Lipomyces tetrasporus]|uniref:Transcriptional regulator of RNA polII, SAGA, subunit-domain-containing protein n=1 Tax=Lipomyces tetrasporus TaxID=54092 RepID=A0AAD7QW12_9ASCO|nr:transcriptional regulator of RNA polII, SAGA, subunit-domain-containing protein [Lipomyces tetrasporus]KAJ8102537.1 transcriptional regulator of RNA polII, SAGA, subunit-domain-containing protein [Lipomyces tetrasporus]